MQPLAERAADDEKIFVRQEALAALKSIGTPEARRKIQAVLADASGLTRWRLRHRLKNDSATLL